MPAYRYEIKPRPAPVGGGWQLSLLEDDVEIAGGVFPASADEADRAATYDCALAEVERARWRPMPGRSTSAGATPRPTPVRAALHSRTVRTVLPDPTIANLHQDYGARSTPMP